MIRDLQCIFNAEGRRYVVEVSAPGKNQAAVSAGPFDVHVMVDVPETMTDDACEPERVVRHVLDYTKPLLPASMPAKQWERFSDVVLAWVCKHRAAMAGR
jgi:hypothetical protein